MSFADLIPWKGGTRALAKQRPGDMFSALQREMNSLFDEFWSLCDGAPATARGRGLSAFSPTITVNETGKEYRVTVELPGLSENDVNVELIGDTLTISGEKKAEHEEKHGATVYSERSYGAFSRSVPLPDAVERSTIKAQFKNGVLTVTLPKKAQATAARKQIEVKSA